MFYIFNMFYKYLVHIYMPRTWHRLVVCEAAYLHDEGVDASLLPLRVQLGHQDHVVTRLAHCNIQTMLIKEINYSK